MTLKSKVGPLTAVVATSIAVTWMVIGENGITASPTEQSTKNSTPTENNVSAESSEATLSYSVQAKTLSVNTVDIHLPLSGTTQANDTLQLVNSYAGRIIKLPVDKGTFIKKGTTIAQIDTRTLRAHLEQARLLVKQRKLELDGVRKLVADNFSTQVNLAQAETELASAKANERSLLVDLENAKVTAPFSGILNTLEAQEGQVVSSGLPVGTLVSLNPLKVNVNIPQNKVQQIKLGTPSYVRLESGYETTGFVSFINTTANEASRTITVEIEVDNPDNKIQAGLTAAVDFTIDQQKAHAFSPALLTLDDSGNTAVKTIDLDNKVVISPVTIVKSERNQVWVSGLPDNVNIITVGQGFVSAGDKIDAHYED